MDSLQIAGTQNSPSINFTSTGFFKIHGRIITENAVITFKPLFSYVEDFEGNAVEFEIELDYINTSASMQLYALLKVLDQNCGIEEIKVRWLYEVDDEDHLETGEFFEDKLDRVKFEFIPINSRSIA
jgi:hypothetical protein